MVTRTDLRKKIPHLAEMSSFVDQLLPKNDHTYLMTRLQAVTVSQINLELGKAWRNRMIVRSRLRKYTSDR
jgi:hypothetical protein